MANAPEHDGRDQDELCAVRAGFVSQGTSLNKWCRENSVARTWAIAALTGAKKGPAASRLKERLSRAAGLE